MRNYLQNLALFLLMGAISSLNLAYAQSLPEGTARLSATEFDIAGSNFYVDYDKWLAINPRKHKTAIAKAISPVGNDSYIVIFHAVGENDGQSLFKIKLGDKELGEFRAPLSKDSYEEGPNYSAVFNDVYINEGEKFEITGEVGSGNGVEYSRGLWRGLTLLPKDATPEQIQSARRSFEDKAQRANAVSLTVEGELKQWHKVTIQFQGPQADEAATDTNPFMDYRFDVEVTHSSGSPKYLIPGYFAADGDAANTSATSGNIWRAHFSPDKPGDWSYKTSFLTGPGVAIGDNGGIPVPEYHELEGVVTIAPTDKTGRDFRAHGRLQYVNKHHLKFAGSNKYFLKAGPDAPETLLAYTGFDNTETRLPKKGPLKTWSPHLKDWKPGDPTWKNGQGKELIGALNYLAQKGVNAFSFLTYNAGGDGDNVWPYINRDDKRHFDVSKLAQWGMVFDHAQAKGLYLHFKLQENELDDNRVGPRKIPQLVPESLDGGATGPERKVYLREIIARFGYHLALNWNLGEENTQSSKEQDDMAEYIREVDPYDHLLVIHTFPSQQDPIYNRLLDDHSIVRGASTQNKWDAAHQYTLRWVERSEQLNTPWVVANDEQNPAGAGVPPDPGYKGFNGLAGDKFGNYDLNDIRKLTLWGNLMAGGAGVEYYFGYWLPEDDLKAQDWRSRDRSWDYARYAIEFFQNNNIPFWEMKTNNALVGNSDNKNDKFAFVKPGDTYVIYLPNGGSVALDLTGQRGNYDVKWYDPRHGGKLLDSKVKTVKGGSKVSLGLAPNNPSEDWAILVRKI